MKSIATALLASLVCTSLAHAQDPTFEFTVSGVLASKLEPDTRVVIWSPIIESKPNWATFSVKDMPFRVPYKQLALHNWIADFISPLQRQRVFSIALSSDLFDKPRRIDLKLDRPTPHIQPSYLGMLNFYYHAGITQRMWYWDLPSWDKENRRIVAAGPPTMSIVRLSDGRKVYESVMEEGCMGAKWFVFVDRSVELGEKAELQLTVRYNSGGLWEPIETKLNFTYQKMDND